MRSFVCGGAPLKSEMSTLALERVRARSARQSGDKAPKLLRNAFVLPVKPSYDSMYYTCVTGDIMHKKEGSAIKKYGPNVYAEFLFGDVKQVFEDDPQTQQAFSRVDTALSRLSGG